MSATPGEIKTPTWWRQLLATERREVQRVLGELMATRGMMPLLMKSRNGGKWTPREKEELVSHLRRLTHLSPYLLLLILPGSALLLPAYAWWLDRRRLNLERARLRAEEDHRSKGQP